MLYNFCFYFLLMLTYSVVGWIVEVFCCSLIEKRLVINRGFLIGPYCPIYGTSAILMIFFLKRYIDDPVVLFVMATVVCTIMEYVTSYIMEKIFKARWWDYSEKKFNLNGRVCLTNSCLFGVLGLFLMYMINPFYSSILLKIPNTILIILGLSLFVFFFSDIILSFVIMAKLKVNTNLISKKDATEEIKQQVHERLRKHKLFTGRLLGAFPKAKSLVPNVSFQDINKIIQRKKKRKHNSLKQK